MQTIIPQRRGAVLPRTLAKILPSRLCEAIERISPEIVEEIRLHSDRQTTLTCFGENLFTGIVLSRDEMQEILKKMCGGSLYAHVHTIAQGYLCLEDGIRVGVCGSAAIEDGRIIGVNAISGLTVRLPHRIEVNVDPIVPYLQGKSGKGILIYAPPGVGKTTLLRELARRAASPLCGLRTVVVDTREELFYSLDEEELTLDVLRGYPREVGIEIAVRSMGAQLILCDEIGGREDAQAILSAVGRGVSLVASAHAASVEDLPANAALGALCRTGVFSVLIGLSRRRRNFHYQIDEWEELLRTNGGMRECHTSRSQEYC